MNGCPRHGADLVPDRCFTCEQITEAIGEWPTCLYCCDPLTLADVDACLDRHATCGGGAA